MFTYKHVYTLYIHVCVEDESANMIHGRVED